MDTAATSFGSSKSSKREVALEHMDYKYIDKCMDTKELEGILRKLESGDEGVYPHLITHCQQRLAQLKPKSKLLIKDSLPATKLTTDKDEWEDIQKGMNEFEKVGTSNASMTDYNNENLPPVRNSKVVTTDKKKVENEEWGKPSKDHIASSNYKAWDKFDADAAAEEVDKDRSAGPSTAVDVNIQHVVDTTGMSEEEKRVKANREKDKGNEAFHSKDFQEALAYYSRSISIQPSLAAYNNRALASIKLKNFNDAVRDCNKVLEAESDNVKALLRRATAKKGLKDYHAAKLDIQQTLSLEPSNKQAKSMLADVVTALSKNKTESKGKRIVIEEVEGSGDEEGNTDNNDAAIANGHDKNIEREVDEADGNICSSKKNRDRNRDQEMEKTKMEGDVNQELSSPEQRSEGESKETNNSETSQQCPQATEPSAQPPAEDSSTQPPAETPSTQPPAEALSTQLPAEAPSTQSPAEAPSTQPPAKAPSTQPPAETPSTQPPTETPSTQPPVTAPSPPPPLPSSTVSFKNQAQKLYTAGQYGQASELYTKAIQTLVADKDIHAVSLATLYSNRAACGSQTGDTRQCIQDCDNALKFAPFLVKPYLRRAKAYETLERYRQAYVDYRTVFRFDPTSKAAQDGSARCMMVLKEQDGPNWREKLPKVSDVQTPIPPIFTTVAKSTTSAMTTSTPVKMSTGLDSSGQGSDKSQSDVKVEKKQKVEEKQEVEDKEKVEEKRMDEDEKSVEVEAQGENEANMAAEDTLRRMAAAGETAKMNESDDTLSIQEQYQAAKEKGNIHHKKGEYDQAIKCYSECVALDKTQTVGYTNRALCHIKINQPLLAAEDCTAALKLDDKNVKALYRRAQSKKMIKEYKMALVDLNTLLKIDPVNKSATKDLETIKELYRNELRIKQMQSVPSTQTQATPTTPASPLSSTQMKATPSPTTEQSEVSIKKKKKNNRKKIQIKEVDGSDEDEESKKETKSEPEEATTTEQVKEPEVSKCEEVEEKPEKKETIEAEKPKGSPSNVKANGPVKSEGKKKKKKKSSSKGANSQIPVDTSPVELKAGTPFEFTQSWASIHNRPDHLQCLADLLLLVQPSKLPQIVSHSLDGELLTALVQSLNTIIVKKDVDMALKVLQYLPKVQRFTTVMMFLSSADKLALQQVFHSLSNAESSKFSKRDVDQLKRKHYAAL